MKKLHPRTMENLSVLLMTAVIFSGMNATASPGDPVPAWNNKAPLNGIIFSSPAIGPNGTIVFGTKNDDIFNPSGNVYAFNPDGSIKWKFPGTSTGPDWFESSPAITADGTVYIGCWNNTLYAIDGKSGNEKWHFTDADSSVLEGAMTASPAMGPDGTIYIGSTNGTMYAVHSNGTEKWTYQTDPELISPISGGAILNRSGNVLYFGDGDGKFHAVDTATGQSLWTFTVPPEHDLLAKPGEREIHAIPALDSDGNIYFTCENGFLYMLSPAGARISEYGVSDSIFSSPVVNANDRIFFCSRDRYLYCVAIDNTDVLNLVWERQVGDVLYSTPAMDELGNLIVAGYTGNATSGDQTTILSVNSNGFNAWTPAIIATINDSSPAIAPDGSIYVGGYDGRMYKYMGAAPLSMSGWPHLAANRRQTGLHTDITAIDLIDLFPGIRYDLQGLSYVPWYGVGWIRADGLPAIYHIEHGRVSIVESNSSGIICYDWAMQRWLFAYNNFPNYFYDANSQRWLYHAMGTSVDDGRWFFDFSGNGWSVETAF